MATLNLSTVELVSTLRAAPENGPTNSQDYNDSWTEALADLASLSGFINDILLPMLNGLSSNIQPINVATPFGIEGRYVFSDTSDTTNVFYDNLTNTSLTVADSLRILGGIVSAVQTTVANLNVEVTALQTQLSSTNQNDIAQALQNFSASLSSLTSQTVSNTQAILNSNITLMTNGVPNAPQNILNLAAGSNITLTESAGTVVITGNSTPATTPAGTDEDIQVNVGGVFYADGNFKYDHVNQLVKTVKLQASVGISTPNIIDASSQAGADWGAQVNAAIALLPAGGGTVDARNFTGSPVMTTSVAPTKPVVILLGAYELQQSAPFVLSNNCSIVGQPGAGGGSQATDTGSVILKQASMDGQIEFSGNNIVLRDLLIQGGNVPGTGPTYTGTGTECGILVDSGSVYCSLQLVTIDSSDGDAITDNGSAYLDFASCNIQYYGANGYNCVAGAGDAQFHGCTVNDSAPTGSFINAPVQGNITLERCYVATSSLTAPAINGGLLSAGGNTTIFIDNCQIYSLSSACYSATYGNLYADNSILYGTSSSVGAVDCQIGNVIISGCSVQQAGDFHGLSFSSTALHLTNCFISAQGLLTANHAGVYYTGDSIGFIVKDNQIQFNGTVGNTYGVWYQPVATHAIMHQLMGNLIYGDSYANGYAVYWDNGNNVGTAGGLTIAHNKFVDVAGGGIVRNDTDGYLATTIFDNESQDGPLFVAGPGNTGASDLVLNITSVLASIPQAGQGSTATITNGTPTNPIRSSTSANGTYATKVGSMWVGSSSPVVAQSNNPLVTTNITSTFLTAGLPAGQYTLNWNAKITTPAGSGSTLGPLLIGWTTPDGQAQVITACAAQKVDGSFVTSTAANSITDPLTGVPLLLSVKDGTQITYAFDFSSSGSAPVAELNIVAEIR